MKGGQQVGPSVGTFARLRQENRDLKDEVDLLQVEVRWLETPMRARHKALLAAAEEASGYLGREDHNPMEKQAAIELDSAIAACKRDGPK